MENSSLPGGFEPETSFMLVAKINGFLNKRIDGRREYYKGRTLKWVVDSDRYSLCELINDLFDKISWGSSQMPRIWMSDKNEGKDVAVVCNAQIQEMFRMYDEEKKIPLAVLVCDSDGSSNSSNTTPSFTCSSSQQLPSFQEGDFSEQYVLWDDVVGNCAAQMDSMHMLEETNLEEATADKDLEGEPVIVYDPENPVIELGAAFADAKSFRKALKHFAIQKEFRFRTIKSDKTRFIGKCKESDCPWRIHASMTQDNMTFKVKVLPHQHTCPSSSMADGQMASQSWVADRIGDWIRKHPAAGAIHVKTKLEDDYKINVTYNKAWMGMKSLKDGIHGSWENSFQVLFNFKAELERRSPGSLVEIDTTNLHNKVYFSKIFVALKPCIDGFLNGCRPYVGIDSTHLTGRFKGQLAAAIGVDGNQGLYPVAYGIFDLETSENWTWFMKQLRVAIGCPSGFTISSDAGKGLVAGIATIYPDAEHRECMRHLMDNFSKRYKGIVFDKNMWPAAEAYTVEKCEDHLSKIKAAKPEALTYLEDEHKSLWCRSKFSELSKCDYVTNNIAESFNSWIKDLKDLHIVDLVDQIRIQIMVRFDKRRKLGAKLQGVILPKVIKQLNDQSRCIGKVSLNRGGDNCAEVNGIDPDGATFRHVVEVDTKECSCREWQLTGKPCNHALAFFKNTQRAHMSDFVHEYYSVDRFRAAYAGIWFRYGSLWYASSVSSKWIVFAPTDENFCFLAAIGAHPQVRRDDKPPWCVDLDLRGRVFGGGTCAGLVALHLALGGGEEQAIF